MIDSVSDILENLKKSRFRKRFQLTAQEITYVQQKGITVVAKHGREFIHKRLAPAEPKKDGKQTPMKGHPFFIAQHATATCCRGCLAKWHGIPKGKELTFEECEYILRVAIAWIDKQIFNQKSDSSQPDLLPGKS